ncbi:MAG TPA: 1-deoxy-D-xylulose-5-phosphate reductoisomerase [Thermoanaerobacterales bacterium]|nr:1-deoxy-D-xylulose-5-phosphate reductoisomerase [Thermoanaerobacterales bacterium]
MNNEKKVAILGTTGSIGTQTLEVIRVLKNRFKVVGMSAGENLDLFIDQIKEFKPRIVSINSEEHAKKIKYIFPDIEVEYGLKGLTAVSSFDEAEIVVVAVTGGIGLIPTYEAIKKGKDIALANKETLVMAGNLIITESKKRDVEILPIDSEHSAIFQCIEGNKHEHIDRLILTASGGPFRGFNKEDLKKVTSVDALKHPNWKMGKKITVDSATLMNKGLEVIEAKWFFNIDYDKIDVVIHPQSIIHSMVEFIDGSIIAQISETDMRIPIQYALTYPNRVLNNFKRIDLLKSNNLTFEQPDTDTFPCLNLAYEAGRIAGTMPAVMNGANDEAVRLFLKNEIHFLEIPTIIEKIMNKHDLIKNPNIHEIMEAEKWAKEEVNHLKLQGR